MNIVLIGTGGHAKVAIDIVEREQKYNIVGLIDEKQSTKREVTGIPIIGNDDDLPSLSDSLDFSHGIICIYDNFTRQRIRNELRRIAPTFGYVTAIHPKSSIGKCVQIGAGTVVMSGVTINSSSMIGEHCIVNTNSSVDHDCIMGDFSGIGPGVNLGGNVKVGDLSYIGIGSSVKHNVRIGDESVVGGSSFVNKDIGNRELGYSSPYRRVRSRQPEDGYL